MSDTREQFLLFRIRTFHDDKAFDALMGDYLESLHRFFRLKLPEREDAEDALISTLDQVWNYVTRSQISSFSGLVFTIARGVVADHYALRERRPQTTSLEHMEDPSSKEGSGAMVASAELTLLREHMNKLSEIDQQIIQFKVFEDLSMSEIAERVQKTENATRVAFHRALKRLKDLFEQNV